MSGLSQQFAGIGVGGNSGGGEYIASMATSMSGDALAMFGRPLARNMITRMLDGRPAFGNRLMGDVGAAGNAAELIRWAITVVDLLELTTGFGPPTEGDDLKTGSQRFTTLCEQLKSALPDSSWQGSASQAYAAQVATLQNLAQTMADLDLKLAHLVKDQADWVTHTRLAMGIVKALLAAAYLITFALIYTPGVGPAAARVFALTVATLGIATAIGMLGTLINFSVKNRQKANGLASQYREVSTAAGAVAQGAQAQAPAAVQSTGAGVEASSAGMAGQEGMPSIAALANSRLASQGASPTQRAALSALTGDGASLGDGWPAALSGYGSQAVNGVNPAFGQIGRVAAMAAMAAKGQGAVAPAKTAAAEAAPVGARPDETALAGDADVGGAGSGTEAAERAPIQPATHSAEPAEPGATTSAS
ncbi:hypothetical protein AWC15_07705 [Mycobacterium lacus]|uniref:EspA/EspE family type VII secretion system effector n=1 Tax=Mycobacterium lacus TaxID=169765 RepID=UPI000A15EF35|nr:hypothetical protein AWC15_07705 [Mycobacterium lacus]